jgi:hypothetical protein
MNILPGGHTGFLGGSILISVGRLVVDSVGALGLGSSTGPNVSSTTLLCRFLLAFAFSSGQGRGILYHLSIRIC